MLMLNDDASTLYMEEKEEFDEKENPTVTRYSSCVASTRVIHEMNQLNKRLLSLEQERLIKREQFLAKLKSEDEALLELSKQIMENEHKIQVPTPELSEPTKMDETSLPRSYSLSTFSESSEICSEQDLYSTSSIDCMTEKSMDVIHDELSRFLESSQQRRKLRRDSIQRSRTLQLQTRYGPGDVATHHSINESDPQKEPTPVLPIPPSLDIVNPKISMKTLVEFPTQGVPMVHCQIDPKRSSFPYKGCKTTISITHDGQDLMSTDTLSDLHELLLNASIESVDIKINLKK